MPLCRSLIVKGSDSRSGRSSVIQYDVVCISFSGSSSLPAPIFSLVKNLIFLKPTTCERTSTSPCERAAGNLRIRLSRARLFGDFQHAHLRVANRVGVVVDVDSLHVRLAFFEVEMLDVILLRAVQVDGFFVHGGQRAGKIDFADDFRLAGDVDDDEIVAGHRAQADGVRGIRFLGPVIVFAGAVQKARFREARAQIGHIDFAKLARRAQSAVRTPRISGD